MCLSRGCILLPDVACSMCLLKAVSFCPMWLCDFCLCPMWLLGRCASVLVGLCATVALWQVVAHCTVIELVMSGLTRKKKKTCCSVLPLVGHSLSSMSESPIAEHMFKYKHNHVFSSLGVSWKLLYLIKSTLVCKALVQSGGVPILVSE